MRFLFILASSLPLAAQTIGSLNGIAIGTSAGEISALNGKPIGSSAGNISSLNGTALPTGGGGTPPAFVQANFCEEAGNDTSITCAFDTNVTSGSLIYFVGRWQYSGDITASWSSTGVTCSASEVFPQTQNTSGSSAQRVQGAYCIAGSSGALSITLTKSGSFAFDQLMVMEYAPINGTPFDVAAVAASSGTSTACSSGATAALAVNGELAVGICSTWDTSETWGAVGGWTYRSDAGNSSWGVYDSIRANTSAVTFSYTLTGADAWFGIVATFKPQ